jgi:hypothetical protein
MADLPDESDPDSDMRPERSTGQREFGYGKPPKHAQFTKGRSGNPSGRPKDPIGISINELFDGDQRGKNGEVISRREALVISIVNEALRGNQRAFSKFMTLMHRSGLMRRETSNRPTVIEVPTRSGTTEDFMRDFGRLHEPNSRKGSNK